MDSMLIMFREGGWSMYIILLLGVFGVAVSAASLLFTVSCAIGKKKAAAGHLALTVVLILIVVSTLALGYGFQWAGLIEMETAILSIDPEDSDARAKVLAMGTTIAGYPWTFSQMAAVVPGFTSLLMMLRTAHSQVS